MLFGEAVDIAEANTSLEEQSLQPAQEQIAHTVRRVIKRAGAFLNLRDTCLAEALAGRWMLRRQGIASMMFIGAETDRSVIDASTHAWLTAVDIPITGYPESRRFLAFAAFPLPFAPIRWSEETPLPPHR